MHVLFRESHVPRPRSEVFAFFSDAGNLERITPKFVGFRILTPQPIEMRSGAIIDYSIRLAGVPMRWRTRIDSFEPETRFVDTQLRGPYAVWHHTHLFEDAPDGGTTMRDVVRYEVPLGPLGELARRVLVRRTLERIFDHRAQAVAELFPARP